MSFALSLASLTALQNQDGEKLLACNEYTEKYGLTLTLADVQALEAARKSALKNTGRIEFGGGITEKLIKEFCDSPFIQRADYAEILERLTEIFYLYKNETLDILTDDELIKWMGKFYNTSCQGSTELLESRELYRLSQNVKAGLPPDYVEPSEQKEEDCGDE